MKIRLVTVILLLFLTLSLILVVIEFDLVNLYLISSILIGWDAIPLKAGPWFGLFVLLLLSIVVVVADEVNEYQKERMQGST